MKNIITSFIICCGLITIAQTPFPENGHVYNDEIIPRIDIAISTEDLDNMYDLSNHSDDVLYPVIFSFDDGTSVDILENVGMRLRGNTSLGSEKKSFKISFNTFEPGRKYHGLEKMNLNGEHNDPSVTRSKLCFDLCRKMEIPASRSNHVRVYINGDYYGLYINVEHIDEEFSQLRFGGDGNLYKCTWPADLVYLGADPDNYKIDAYELKTNLDENDYSDFSEFVDILNNTADAEFQCEIERVFNVQKYLRVIAFDILAGNWDGPIFNKNNFYLYHNPTNGKFEYIPYDLDNTLGIRWFGSWTERNIYNWDSNEPRPIYKRIMENDTYRKQFTFYMDEFLQEYFNESYFYNRMIFLKNLISDAVFDDPYYPLDYGFTFDDFNTCFEEGLNVNHVPHGITEYALIRRSSALDQLENTNAPPIITELNNNHPSETEEIIVTAKIEDETVPAARIYFQLNGSGSNNMILFDDGQHEDGAANDGIYGVIIPALNQTGIFTWYIEAMDNQNNINRFPYCDEKSFYIGSSELDLYINEFMASNEAFLADEAGEFDDWLEIYNGSDEPIYLGDKYLSDNVDNPDKWAFPDEFIQAGEYILIWADSDPEQGKWHTNFKLSASGETIALFDANVALVDMIAFGEQNSDEALGRLPNGTGDFQAVLPTPGASNEPPLNTDINIIENIHLDIFPNPSDGNFSLFIKNMEVWEIGINIVDYLGREIWKEEITNFIELKKDIKLSGIASGVYFLNLKSEGIILKSKKLVIY